MTKKVRWGLVSTANINRRTIPGIRLSDRGELVAVGSRSLEKAQAYAAKWDIPLAFGSYADMFASGQVDAVYISVPNELHAPLTIQALEAGIHVLCEKPFAVTLKDVDAMFAAARANDCVLAEAFMYRHHPQTKKIGELIQSGKLGEIRSFSGSFSFPISTEQVDGQRNVRLEAGLSGGSLWDVGVYPVSLAQYVMGGPPIEVWGQQTTQFDIDMNFAGQMVYGNGRTAHFTSSFDTAFQTRAEIRGTLGRLELTRPFTGTDESDRSLKFFPKQGDPEEVEVEGVDEYLYVGEVNDMNAAILDGADSYLTAEETRNHVKTALALYQSAKENRIVQL
jgi:xylose dehydrogenase (NAD/NADP)